MDRSADTIESRLRRLRERVTTAATAAGRDPAAIRLIAVSKYQSVERIRCAIAAGQTVFGENTVQEALTRAELMHDRRTEWHFIGHLQANKAKHVPGRFSWLHTLDSLKLARKLSAAASRQDRPLQLLLQVNISGDPDKHGLQPAAVFPFVEEFLGAGLPGLALRGLMTIGRRSASEPEREADFDGLRQLRDACGRRFGEAYFPELSMGMSADFETAIRAGSTMVRIGSAIFGARPEISSLQAGESR